MGSVRKHISMCVGVNCREKDRNATLMRRCRLVSASFRLSLCLFLFAHVSRRENKLTPKSGKQQQAQLEAQKLNNLQAYKWIKSEYTVTGSLILICLCLPARGEAEEQEESTVVIRTTAWLDVQASQPTAEGSWSWRVKSSASCVSSALASPHSLYSRP